MKRVGISFAKVKKALWSYSRRPKDSVDQGKNSDLETSYFYLSRQSSVSKKILQLCNLLSHQLAHRFSNFFWSGTLRKHSSGPRNCWSHIRAGVLQITVSRCTSATPGGTPRLYRWNLGWENTITRRQAPMRILHYMEIWSWYSGNEVD